MATHVKIKTSDNNHVHVDTHRNNYTLCGLETGGDLTMGIQKPIVTNRKINCPDCLWIIRFCRTITDAELT